MYMMSQNADTKLRSFNVSSIAKYKKFAEIQTSKGKNISQRLNELIEKEVKEADPLYVDKSAARTPKMQDLVIPNPFIYDQPQSLPLWEEYLKTLTQKEHQQVYIHILALKSITYSFTDHADSK
jgi:hypothetical protein